MDDAARIATFKQGLRFKYEDDAAGLRAYVTSLMNSTDGEALDSVVITNQAFEGGQASGALVLEPLAKLAAAMEVLAEMDPDNVPTPPATSTFADFSAGVLET